MATRLETSSSSTAPNVVIDAVFARWKAHCDSIVSTPSELDFAQSGPIAVLSEIQVRELITKDLSLGEVVKIEDSSKGDDQNVFLVWTESGNSVVVKQPKADRIKIYCEHFGCAIAGRLRIPAPKILHMTTEVIVQTMVPGKPFDNSEHKTCTRPAGVYFELGQHLRKLHSIKVPFYGEPFKNVFTSAVNDIDGWFSKDLEKLLKSNRLRSEEEKATVIEYFKRGREKFLVNEERKPTWLHGDIHDHNFFSDEDTATVTGIIDWADICSGVPEEDFGISFACGIAPEHFEVMMEGYGKDALNLEMILYFAATRLANMILGGSKDIESLSPHRKRRLNNFRNIVGLPPMFQNI